MNNSNSEASGEAPVYTLTSRLTLRHEQQSKHNCKEAAKTAQSKQERTEDIPKEDAVSVVLHKEWKLKIGGSSITDGKTGRMTAGPRSVNAEEPIKSSVFGKWEMMDRDEQRSLAKRQLSEESKIHRLMKSTVMEEEESRKTSNTASGKLRKLRKDLIPNPEAFREFDTHAINTGREVRDQMSFEISFIWICNLQLRIKRIFSVQAITQTITEGAIGDLDKLRAIWIWLCHSIGLSFIRTYSRVFSTSACFC